MTPRLKKLSEDGVRVALAAAAGITATAIVFLAGMFAESHLVTRELFAHLEPALVHAATITAERFPAPGAPVADTKGGH